MATPYYRQHFKNGTDFDVKILGQQFRPTTATWDAYYSEIPDISGLNPLESWNDLVTLINRRTTTDLVTYDFAFRGVKETAPASSDYQFEGQNLIPQIPLAQEKHRISKQDILMVRDTLRAINPFIKFNPIPRIFSKQTLLELLVYRWIVIRANGSTDNGGLVNLGTSVLENPGGAIGGFVFYQFDMEDGLGPRAYSWSVGFGGNITPDPAQSLLDRWAMEDRFEGQEKPTPRGKVIIDFRPLQLAANAEGSGSLYYSDTYTIVDGFGKSQTFPCQRYYAAPSAEDDANQGGGSSGEDIGNH